MGDVAYMKPYEKENVPYLLVLIDGFNRYLSVYLLESLKSSDVDRILNEFLNTSIYKYEKNFTDEAVEFTSKLAKKMYRKKHQVHLYTTLSKTIKVTPVVHVILTLKIK